MQPTSVTPLPTYLYPPNHKQLLSAHNSRIPTPTTTKTTRRTIFCSHSNKHTRHKFCLTTADTTSTSSQGEEKKKRNIYGTKNLSLEEMYSFLGNNNKDKGQQQEEREEQESDKIKSHRVILTNMWWQNLKATLGQRLNLEGIASSATVVSRDQRLSIPHLTVPDIRWIDWPELERRGFRGVVFDKDNTLTAPYSLALWPPLDSSLQSCKSVFHDNLVVFSNSAGLHQYDADGSKARAIEESIGIHVIRHGVKKPAGTAEDIEKYFGCATSLLIMVGDRHFTDIVYGNRNGFLTILTEPLSLVEEPFIVKQVRKLEASLVNYWYRKGLRPTNHSLLPEAMQCVKGPPPL